MALAAEWQTAWASRQTNRAVELAPLVEQEYHDYRAARAQEWVDKVRHYEADLTDGEVHQLAQVCSFRTFLRIREGNLYRLDNVLDGPVDRTPSLQRLHQTARQRCNAGGVACDTFVGGQRCCHPAVIGSGCWDHYDPVDVVPSPPVPTATAPCDVDGCKRQILVGTADRNTRLRCWRHTQ